ncbi:MAG: hypothetical protein ABII19_01795 [Patescibacteria group bacterium]
MRVTKCDNCGEEIKSTERKITAGINWSAVELCENCGAPIASFLENLKLLEKI